MHHYFIHLWLLNLVGVLLYSFCYGSARILFIYSFVCASCTGSFLFCRLKLLRSIRFQGICHTCCCALLSQKVRMRRRAVTVVTLILTSEDGVNRNSRLNLQIRRNRKFVVSSGKKEEENLWSNLSEQNSDTVKKRFNITQCSVMRAEPIIYWSVHKLCLV